MMQIEEANSGIKLRLGIILCIIIVGLASNLVRSYLDFNDDAKQKRIEYLDQRIIKLEQQLDSCNSGTPMPFIKDKAQ